MGQSKSRKQGQKKKRDQKKQSARRAASGSPYLRIGQAGELSACYINPHWEDDGTASIYVLRAAPSGGYAIGSYLIDLWCMGLKEAYGRIDATKREFDLILEDSAANSVELVRVDPKLVRQLVAGGIRFAMDNGFSLPRHHKRWTAILGELDGPETADLDWFGVDGKIRYMGGLEDLKRRLVGCTLEDFTTRDDVELCVNADNTFTLRDDEEMEFDNAITTIAGVVLDKAKQWCFANHITPHARLRDAIELMMEGLLQTDGELDADDVDDATSVDAVRHIDTMLAMVGPNERAELLEAWSQVQSFMGQYSSPEDLFESLGFEDDAELESGATE